MKKMFFACCVCLLVLPAAAVAQENAAPNLRRDATPVDVPKTPEMWLYEQERQRYADSAEAVRRQAEFRAAERQRRIESRKWYGYSLARPVLSPTPWWGLGSPSWTSNSLHPFYWHGTIRPVHVAQRPPHPRVY